MKGLAALVGEKTFENDRGGNAERWDSAESTKANRKLVSIKVRLDEVGRLEFVKS